jgi:hypothetical protein
MVVSAVVPMCVGKRMCYCVRSNLAVLYCSNFENEAVVLHVLLPIVVTATIGGSFCVSNAVDCC